MYRRDVISGDVQFSYGIESGNVRITVQLEKQPKLERDVAIGIRNNDFLVIKDQTKADGDSTDINKVLKIDREEVIAKILSEVFIKTND